MADEAHDESKRRASDPTSLPEDLARAMRSKSMTVELLANRTKIPRSTVAALLGEETAASLPERVYLRAQAGVLARELGLDVRAALAKFDAEHPRRVPMEVPLPPRTSTHAMTMVVAMSLAGIGIIAVILAFVR